MIKRKIASALMAAVLAASALPVMSATASAAWVKSESGYSYKDDTTGKKLTGWQTIDGSKYYFDKNGYAVNDLDTKELKEFIRLYNQYISMLPKDNKFEFFKVMNEMGYKVTWTKERKNITYTTSEGYKCRDRKLHNEKYLKENMEAYFKEKYKARIKGVKKYERHTQYRSMSLSLAELIKQFQRKEHENDITHHYELNESAKKQYAMEMHYSLEELEDMEM